MTTVVRRDGQTTYQVRVAGLLGPALRQEFADLSASSGGVDGVPTAVGRGAGSLADLAAILQQRGLVLLRVRILRGGSPPGAPGEAEAPPSDQARQTPSGARPDT